MDPPPAPLLSARPPAHLYTSDPGSPSHHLSLRTTSTSSSLRLPSSSNVPRTCATMASATVSPSWSGTVRTVMCATARRGMTDVLAADVATQCTESDGVRQRCMSTRVAGGTSSAAWTAGSGPAAGGPMPCVYACASKSMS